MVEVEDRVEEDPNSSPLFRASSEGVIQALVFDIPRFSEEGSVWVSFEGGSASGPVPFYPSPKWVVAPDGSRIGALSTGISEPEAGTYQVRVHDGLGGQVFSRAYPYRGVPIPDHVVDSVLEVLAEWASHPVLKRVYQTEVKDRIPPIYPPVEEIVLGSDGRTWIGLYGGDEGEPWLILDVEGNPEGRVVLPPRTKLHVANATHIWALERDQLDVESIVRYRVLERD